MTDRQTQWERIGNILAVVMAVMLASVIVALAQEPEPITLIPPPAVAKIELKQPKPRPALILPGAISQVGTAGEALKKLIAEHRCLAEAMYFEARGEDEMGQRAVAAVILHRLAEGSRGRTICGVVYEGAGETFCQFTFACDGSLDRPKAREPWRAAQVLAARLLAGEAAATDEIEGATYFHTASVTPTWAPKMQRLAQIGNHIFYREKTDAIRVAFRGPLQ